MQIIPMAMLEIKSAKNPKNARTFQIIRRKLEFILMVNPIKKKKSHSHTQHKNIISHMVHTVFYQLH